MQFLTRRRQYLAAAFAASTLSLNGISTATAAPTQISWEQCPAEVNIQNAQCGRIDVPMNYANPSGKRIDVGLVKLPAKQQSRGSLFFNPGGPGGSVYDVLDANSLAPVTWPEEIRKEWDIIAVQPRGLEGSTPLECEIPADQSLIGLINFGGKLKETCDQNIPGYTDNINTETTAHDWDEVRKALGEEKISLLGTSYGTYLASMYATKFPNNTDKVILDSGYNVDADTTEQLRGFDEAMADFLTWVARHDATYHLGTTPEAVYARWSQRITDETGASPTITPPNATNLERVSTDLKGLWTQITSGGGNQANSPTLLLTQVYLGIPTEWPKLAKTIASPEPTVLPESLQTFEIPPMAPILTCNDRNVPIRPTHLASGMWSQITGHPYATIHFLASGVHCAGAETKQPAPAISGEKLAIKPLQIQGTRDPNTPYWNFQDMAQAMQSHVLTVEGPGHVQGLTGNKELNKIIGEYLRTGSTTETKIAGIDPKPEP